MTTNQYLHFFGYDDEDMEDDRWESDGSNDSDKENVDPDHAVHSPAVPHGLLPSALPPVPRRDRPRRVAPPPEFEIYEPTAAEEAAALAEHYEVEYEHDDIENQHSGPAPCLLPGAHRVSSDSIMGPVSPNRTASLSSSDNE